MKKIILVVAFFAILFGQNSFAQNNATSPLLVKYYVIKDALVSGNAELASTAASDFSKAITSIDVKEISVESRTGLLKDALDISQSKDLKKQRGYFKVFSDHLFQVAKTTSLSSEPIYKAYCPMAKASWLSSSSSIKNPYFGNSMLTCGKVVETLKYSE